MARRLEYNGRPEFNRRRNIREEGRAAPINDTTQDKAPPPITDRERVVEQLFDDLSRTYLKGNKLREGLAGMDPAQFIPIEIDADKTRAAATRFDKDQSRNGEIITYSMYQRAVDESVNKNWEVRRDYLRVNIPASKEQTHRQVVDRDRQDSQFESIIKEFIAENGIAGTILAALTLAPAQSIIWATSIDPGPKGVNLAQIPAGLALFLEFGIKAERIYSLLNQANIAISEEQVERLAADESARAAALESAGIDYQEFKASMAPDDRSIILDYVSDYYKRYGGLVEGNSHLTIDHWIAYLQTSQNQQLIRGALNTADKFSTKYAEFRQPETTQFGVGGGTLSQEANSRRSRIHIDFGSVLRELNSTSNTTYDDIAQSFLYSVSDQELCCLVQLFGSFDDVELLRTIATILRILSVDLGGEFVRLDNLVRRYIAKELQAVHFELVAQLNEFYDKVQSKIARTFTIDIDGAEACGGLLTVGFAILKSLEVIYQQMRGILNDIAGLLLEFGEVEEGSWAIAADRRALVSIAKILETVANRLEIASICDRDNTQINTVSVNPAEDIKDQAAREIITTILEKPNPTLQVTNEDLNKYFPDLEPRESSLLKFRYGYRSNPTEEQVKQDTEMAQCGSDFNAQQIETLIEQIKQGLRSPIIDD